MVGDSDQDYYYGGGSGYYYQTFNDEDQTQVGSALSKSKKFCHLNKVTDFTLTWHIKIFSMASEMLDSLSFFLQG